MTANYTTLITLQPQLPLHYATTTTTVAVHHTTSSSCGWGDHCNHCNHSSKHNSNHFSVNQWIRSAIRDSQQPTSPIGFLFWNFRHRLVRYYWYDSLFYSSLYNSIQSCPLLQSSLPPRLHAKQIWINTQLWYTIIMVKDFFLIDKNLWCPIKLSFNRNPVLSSPGKILPSCKFRFLLRDLLLQ